MANKELVSKKEDLPRLEKKYEAIFKFPAQQKETFFSLLKETKFSNIRIGQIDEGNSLLAYCKYQGDIKELDKELLRLKGKALLTIGERKEGGIFEFFISFDGIIPYKLIGQSPAVQRKYPIAILSILLIIGIFWGGKTLLPTLVSKVEKRNYPALTRPLTTYPSWNRFVLPQFQSAWLKIKKDYNLEDREMVELFKLIKDIPKYRSSAGQRLNDLTIYPEIINRALGLIVLKNVKDLKELKGLFNELELKFLHSQSFPNEQVGKYVNMLDGRQFENLLILILYGDVLLKNEDFTKRFLSCLFF